MSPLFRYLWQRLGFVLLVILVAMIAIFFLGRVIGDPVSAIVSEFASDEVRDMVREEHGFDDSLLSQFTRYVGNIATLDFGTSTVSKRPAMEQVLKALPNTIKLTVGILVVSIPVGLLIGGLGALRPGSLIDRIGNVLALMGVSIVPFWLGLTLIVLVAIPISGIPTGGSSGWAALLLPVMTGSFRLTGRIAQFCRSALLEEYGKPHIEMARAKGLSETRVFSHAAKGAAIPVVTMWGDELVHFVNGEVIIEIVFAWPGMGRLIVKALFERDLFVLEAAIFVLVVFVAIANLLVDLTYAFLNPKLRYD